MFTQQTEQFLAFNVAHESGTTGVLVPVPAAVYAELVFKARQLEALSSAASIWHGAVTQLNRQPQG